MEIPETMAIHPANNSQLPAVPWDNLEFGKYPSDHMMTAEYVDGSWLAPSIHPYGNLSLSPMALALHYGQTIFEGMKAFRLQDGRISIFRPRRHLARMARSAKRMCMPVIPEEIFLEGLTRLVELDSDWVSSREGYSLYLRPFMIATEPRLGVKVSREYRFMIVTSPCAAFFKRPLVVKVETEYVRAAKGGPGFSKCGGNYGAALFPSQQATAEGYDQVLWTDGRENRFIEESGIMNIFLVIGDRLVTPPLSDTILDGITRDSILQLARYDGIHTEERPVSVEELARGLEAGQIREAFGTGTAATVVPISTIGIAGINHELAVTGTGLGSTLKKKLEDIRTGRVPDIFDWNYIL
jgi:branched-chain amino acid aminotransferase